MRHVVGRCAAAMGLAAVVLGASSAAHATTCGSVSAGWNVPNGAAVFEMSPGPIASVLAAVGEYRSHSMLSRGPDGWVTHATSITPPTSSSASLYLTPFCSSCGNECWNPLNVADLYAAMPGLETVTQGGIYNFLYGSGAPTYIMYQNASNSSYQTAVGNNFLGTNMAWSGWWSGSSSVGNQDSSAEYTYIWDYTYNGTAVPYGWYQYMNIQSSPQGVMVNSYNGNNTGVVCSSSLAAWQHDTLASSGQPDVLPRSYSNGGSTTGPLYQSANALWNAVYNECESQNGWFSSVGAFFTNLGWTVLCAGSGESGVCNAAADQMVNCFDANHCGNTSGPSAYNQGEWHSIVGGANAAASGISPDNIAGVNANGRGGGNSIWQGTAPQSVQWNSGGSTYGCWD